MKPTVVITIITAVLAIAAGVAIAGLPSTPPGADIVILEVPTVETRPVPSLAELTVQPMESTTTQTLRTVGSTSTSTTTATTAPSTSTSQTQSTARTTTTTTTVPDDDPADVLRERGELSVAAANASDVSGVATEHATALNAAGYVDVAPIDAAATPVSTVYYAPGFELEAARLASDLGWDRLVLAPMSALPEVFSERTFELIALIGLDRT